MDPQENSQTEGTEQAAEATEQESDQSTEADVSQEGDEGKDDDWRNNFDPDRARDKIRKLTSESKNLRERAKSAEEKAAGVDEKDKQIGALEARTLRYEVAFDLGLPKELVPRLQGSTKEELLEDAEKLLELVTPAKRPPTKRPVEDLRGGGEPAREPEETDLTKIGDRMFRR